MVFVSTSIPGPEKGPDGIDRVFAEACDLVGSRLDAVLLGRGVDAAGPWALFLTAAPPDRAKLTGVGVEADTRAGRLLDIDVYHEGRQVDRASLGLPPRPCLVCDRPAVECIRLKRHAAGTLDEAVESLLVGPRRVSVRLRGASGGPEPRAASARQADGRAVERLAACLVTGARIELALTPKPGLVNRRDNGSHPDLSYELMTRSIELLPRYFDELMAVPADTAPGTGLPPGAGWIRDCIEAGRRAERRMVAVVGSNAHRGYIFLSGLALLGSLRGEDHLRVSLREIARGVMDARRDAGSGPRSHGAEVRERHALGGILREALEGLPAVFDHGLPALRRRRASHDDRRGADTDETLHYAMAVLMQVVEDTTAVHRCGPEGLQRLRQDGRHLQQMIEQARPYLRWLDELNTSYRRLNLTMGGVADCLALAVALDRWMEGGSPRRYAFGSATPPGG